MDRTVFPPLWSSRAGTRTKVNSPENNSSEKKEDLYFRLHIGGRGTLSSESTWKCKVRSLGKQFSQTQTQVPLKLPDSPREVLEMWKKARGCQVPGPESSTQQLWEESHLEKDPRKTGRNSLHIHTQTGPGLSGENAGSPFQGAISWAQTTGAPAPQPRDRATRCLPLALSRILCSRVTGSQFKVAFKQEKTFIGSYNLKSQK